jgi:hypothetical protein
VRPGREDGGHRPLQEAHQLTFAAEAARAGGAAAAPGTDRRSAWEAAAQAWERLGQPYQLARALVHAAVAATAEAPDNELPFATPRRWLDLGSRSACLTPDWRRTG